VGGLTCAKFGNPMQNSTQITVIGSMHNNKFIFSIFVVFILSILLSLQVLNKDYE